MLQRSNNQQVEYQYDTQGRVSLITDVLGVTQYAYATNGDLQHIDGPLADDTISFSYDKRGQLETLKVNAATNAAYQYDDFGRLSSVNAQGKTFSYHYDPTLLALSASMVHPSCVVKKAQFNKGGELSQLNYLKQDQVIADYQYRYDEAGQLAEQTGTPAWAQPQQNVGAKYNALNQIIEWNGNKAAFVYDLDGNPTAGILSGNTPFTAQYDAENRLVQLDFTRGEIKYSERFVYQYDHMLAQYQLYQDNILTKTKQFVRLGLVELQQRNADNRIEQEYAWHPGAPGGVGGLLLAKTANNHYEYIYNQLGSVQKVLDKSGEVVADYQYTPYGQVSGSNFSQQPFGYSTKRSDFASGLVYFGYRFYAPEQRRWLNRDPLHEQGGINLYAYVNGDPLGYIDPTGEYGIAGAVYGAIAGGIGGHISGGWQGALIGVGTGALVGAVNPFGANAAGAAAGAGIASLLSQGVGNLASGNDVTDLCNYDFSAAAGAAIGGALGGPLGNFIGRYVGPYRYSIIGRPLSAPGINNVPGNTVGVFVEGASAGAGEFGGQQF